MSFCTDAWDAYRLFCISAAASTSFESGAPSLRDDELQDRLGLVEEHVVLWDTMHDEFHQSRDKLCLQERRRLMVDEAEERRFIVDDSAFLPHKLFAQVVCTAAHDLFFAHEAEARRLLFGRYLESFRTTLFSHDESLQRMHVTYEALDSLAMKACRVGRYGVREGQLARTSVPGHTFEPPLPPSSSASSSTAVHRGEFRMAAAMWLVKQEEEERLLLDDTHHQFMTDAARVMRKCEERCAALMWTSQTRSDEATPVSAQ